MILLTNSEMLRANGRCICIGDGGNILFDREITEVKSCNILCCVSLNGLQYRFNNQIYVCDKEYKRTFLANLTDMTERLFQATPNINMLTPPPTKHY